MQSDVPLSAFYPCFMNWSPFFEYCWSPPSINLSDYIRESQSTNQITIHGDYFIKPPAMSNFN
jgi:hypothetical protein